jgi:hypothetical protein
MYGDIANSWDEYCAQYIPGVFNVINFAYHLELLVIKSASNAVLPCDDSGQPVFSAFDVEFETAATMRSILAGYLEQLWDELNLCSHFC